jgi:hypothetical protein
VQEIGLSQQPVDPVNGDLIGPVASLTSGRWTISASGYSGSYTFRFDQYESYLNDSNGRAQTDEWGDPFIFQKQDMKTKATWIGVEGSLSFRVHRMLSLTVNGLYRRFERSEQSVTADLYSVDLLNNAWYGEGEIEASLPAYKNEGTFIGGGAAFQIPLWDTPISLDGSAVLLGPVDSDQDLRFSWSAGITWSNLAGFSFLFGYRDDLNAHDPARERIRGFAMTVEYGI